MKDHDLESNSNNNPHIKLLALLEQAKLGGGIERLKKQKEQGKYTARERIEKLTDPGSFTEFDQLVLHKCTYFGQDKNKILGDGVVTGIATINGKKVALYSQDFTAWGGALGMAHAQKICKIMDFATKNNIPIIGMNDSGGARIQEGVESLAGYADIFYRNVQASGQVPQISLILGPCAGGAVYSPAMTDFIFMVEKTSYMFVTGPDVIKTVTHESITKEDLGGSKSHNSKSGVAHFNCATEDELFERVRELLHFLPSNYLKSQVTEFCNDPIDRKTSSINNIIPINAKKPYDMKSVILEIVDNHHFLEIQQEFARNIIIGFASMGGTKVGFVANQPNYLAGVLDIDASNKAARFVRFCDCFNIPIITLVDVPGFLPGSQQEAGGIIRHGAKLLFAFAEATVPLITLITRKAYGGAYDVMASKHIKADINLALPTAEIAVMGAEGAVNIIFRKELEDVTSDKVDLKRKELLNAYEQEFAGPYKAAELGYVDEIILPDSAREKICFYLDFLKNKTVITQPKKHNNIPL